jgi:hypothetical protein
MRGKKCKTGYILEKELSTSRGEPQCNSLDSGVPVVDSWTIIAILPADETARLPEGDGDLARSQRFRRRRPDMNNTVGLLFCVASC